MRIRINRTIATIATQMLGGRETGEVAAVKVWDRGETEEQVWRQQSEQPQNRKRALPKRQQNFAARK